MEEEDSVTKYTVRLYSNFMRFTISNNLYNLLLIIIENMTIFFVVDQMMSDNILGEVLTPLYFLSPHLYLDIINEQFPNECNFIFNKDKQVGPKNATLEEIEEENEAVQDFYVNFNDNDPTLDINFFGKTLIKTDNSYCVYSSKLIIIIIGIMGVITICLFLLFIINTRNKPNLFVKSLVYVLANFIHLSLHPFFIVIVIILTNRPILYLYKSGNIKSEYKTEELIYFFVSFILLIYSVLLCHLHTKYINNIFHFEKFPYDFFGGDETFYGMVIKIVIGLKINFDKLNGKNALFSMSLIVMILIVLRGSCTMEKHKYTVNHVLLKNTSSFLCYFNIFYLLLKLANSNVKHLEEFSGLNLTLELTLIIFVSIFILGYLFKRDDNFVFGNTEDFLEETMDFMYYVSRNLTDSVYKERKGEMETFIDNIIIGHKMKCKMEECVICCEDIYDPNIKTLTMILFQQFLNNEKEFKEKDEGLTLLIKLMYLKMIDDKKIHRLCFIILKNLKNKNLSFDIIVKLKYLYEQNLDELNTDLKGLLEIKYGEMNTELLDCIKNYEDILGFIKTRTEKVELVTNKTNAIGGIYKSLISDLHYLKENKRIYFSVYSYMQIICIVKLLFTKALDNELSQGINIGFEDYIKSLDDAFNKDDSILVKYDFNNKTWRITKLPENFILFTGFKVNELLDQSLEKIFPRNLGKTRIKTLESEILMATDSNRNLSFRTEVCDNETNVKSIKFEIDIIPHLENSFMLHLHCHFHKKQLLIVDEFGNLVNGNQTLYEKIGINADIVSSSKGKINMFTMFGLDRKQKLEDLKVVHVENEGIILATKNIFLIENENVKKIDSRMRKDSTLIPGFLNAFINKEASLLNKTIKEKPDIVVFLKLLSKEVVSDIKYLIYNITIKNEEEKGKGDETQKDDIGQDSVLTIPKEKQNNINDTPGRKQSVKHTVTLNRINTQYSNSSDGDPLLNNSNNGETPNGDPDDKTEKEKKEETNNFQSYAQYYDAFYDSKHSVSMSIEKKNLKYEGVVNGSIGETNVNDVFNLLFIGEYQKKSHANKFETFIYGIFMFNICLVLYGLCSIIYIKTYSKKSMNLVDVLEMFYTMSNRIFKSTNNFFCYFKYNISDGDYIYDKYIKQKMKENMNVTEIDDVIQYDELIQIYLDYDSSLTLNDIINFNNKAYDYLGEEKYESNLNYYSYFIHLEPSGSFTIKRDKMKNVINLFTLTINQLSNKPTIKILFDLTFLDYTYHDTTKFSYPELMTLTESTFGKDKTDFTDLINLYQHFFNYFNAFALNFKNMGNFLNSVAEKHFNSLHNTGKSLLIVILIINIIFVLICLFSIMIYKKILKKEFHSLYGVSEEVISNLKEKFQYVKELIKLEQAPSKIYAKIRKMRENIELAQQEEKKKKQIKLSRDLEGVGDSISLLDDNAGVNDTSTNNNIKTDYLRFSGAVKGLYKSSTLMAKEHLKKINKENRKQKASIDLLKRLNFDFEMVQNFIFFIVFMCLFYLVVGIVVIVVSDSNFNNVINSLYFVSRFHRKFYNLFNFYSATKLSVYLNKTSPYTLYSNETSPECDTCIFSLLYDYSTLTGEISNLGQNSKELAFISELSNSLQGSDICKNFYYERKSSMNRYVEKAVKEKKMGNFEESMISICNILPILKSNVDSIMTNLMIGTRKIYSKYLALKDKSKKSRIKILTEDYIELDIVMTMFVNFYYEYVYQEDISVLNKENSNKYYNFMVVIFVINIFIDFFMIVFIWFKMYTQIINSVNSVQLVTDSVSAG